MSTPDSPPCQNCPHARAALTILQPPTTAAALAARVAKLESQYEMTIEDLKGMVGG